VPDQPHPSTSSTATGTNPTTIGAAGSSAQKTEKHVVVIGAGLSGLTAAYELQEAAKKAGTTFD